MLFKRSYGIRMTLESLMFVEGLFVVRFEAAIV